MRLDQKLIFLLSITALLVAGNCIAAETGTFSYLYSESIQINWWVAIGVAVAIGLLSLLTFGAAAPPGVAYIGTLIGSAKGLTGVAATNYGLALLGGGAIASGGMGMAGGIAFLSSVLTFSTQVLQDYAVSKILQKYTYSQMAEESKMLPTLPPFVRAEGPASYLNAFEKIKTYNKEEASSSNFNQSVLREAIRISKNDYAKAQGQDQIQLGSLLSYAYFATNQYAEAAQQAKASIKLAREMNVRATLPAYIYSVSALYSPKPDFATINDDYFRYSVVAEPDNDLIPFMFSIYLSHINLRYRGETAWYYQEVSRVATDKRVADYSDQILPVILVNYFVNLKVEQQRISALTGSASKTIKESPVTLADTEKSLKEYKSLLWGTRTTLDRYKIKPELSASEKLLVDAKAKLEKAKFELNRSTQKGLSQHEVMTARVEAERLFKESQATLLDAQVTLSKAMPNNLAGKEIQQFQGDLSNLFNTASSRMKAAGDYFRNYLAENQSTQTSIDKASTLIEGAHKSMTDTQQKIKKMLHKEQLKREQIKSFEKLLSAYDGDYKRLNAMVGKLKDHQSSMNKKGTFLETILQKIPGHQ